VAGTETHTNTIPIRLGTKNRSKLFFLKNSQEPQEQHKHLLLFSRISSHHNQNP